MYPPRLYPSGGSTQMYPLYPPPGEQEPVRVHLTSDRWYFRKRAERVARRVCVAPCRHGAAEQRLSAKKTPKRTFTPLYGFTCVKNGCDPKIYGDDYGTRG